MLFINNKISVFCKRADHTSRYDACVHKDTVENNVQSQHSCSIAIQTGAISSPVPYNGTPDEATH